MQERKRRKEMGELHELEHVEVKRPEYEKPIKRKWEYRVVILNTVERKQNKVSESWTDTLSKLGKDGWELVAVIPMTAQFGFFSSPPHVRCFFKREVE